MSNTVGSGEFSRARWSEEDGRRAVDAWRASGLNRRVWCAQHGVALHRLYYWQERLARNAEPDSESALGLGGFIPVLPVREHALQVCFDGGAVTVRVAVGFDATLLRAVVEALR